MDRLILTGTVRHEGTDYRGRRTSITFDPAPHQDWVWRVNGEDVPITADCMESRPRRVALSYLGHSFNEFEHVGILRAAGLREVRVSLEAGKDWPPYSGSSFALWQAVMPHVRICGELAPYYPLNQIVHRAGDERWTRYGQERNGGLSVGGRIDYPGLGKHDFKHSYPNEDLRPLVRARTLGWPPRIKPWLQLASMLGLWPHYMNVVWPGDEPAQLVLEETGRHRMLDMLGILNFAAPADTYLAGALYSYKGSHETDLAVLKSLTDRTLRSLEQAVEIARERTGRPGNGDSMLELS